MKKLSALIVLTACLYSPALYAQTALDYSAETVAQTSTGAFAPYFLGSLTGGRSAAASAAQLDVTVAKSLDLSQRWSWAAGVELISGYGSPISYSRWDASGRVWTESEWRQSAAWIQQLYAEVKHRGVFLRIGQKDPHSALLDERVTSGDITRSCNARGIPGIEAGFVNFQDIPLTDGWIQIEGTIQYGPMTDDSFDRAQFNRFNGILTSDLWYSYKRCFFRTKPSQSLCVTAGMQVGAMFAGSTSRYYQGQLVKTETRGFKLWDMARMFFPLPGNTSDGFYEGSSLGSWDFSARLRLDSSRSLTLAFQWPWEDGSSIGRRNGIDGVWGVYYSSERKGIVNAAAVEYLDFTNQSGPIHWAPGDFPGTTNTGQATGADDYYNNEAYGAYANYGLSIGTPFLMSPMYNLNGYPGFANNRARGFHAAVTGTIFGDFDYSVKYSWQKAWGTGRILAGEAMTDHSVLLGVVWHADALVRGLDVSARAALDAGELRGDNAGAQIALKYSGNLSLK